MKSIQVANGDIVVNSGSLQFVTGSDKLVQAISLWLMEPLFGNPPKGPGYTTPNFGSLLSSYVGQANSTLVQSQIQTEVLRILGLFQQNQLLQLQQAQSVSALGNWNKSEIIQKVISVNVSVNTYTANVAVAIQTLANTILPLNIIIGQNGITVN